MTPPAKDERIVGPAIMFADGSGFHWQPTPASHYSVSEEMKKHFPHERPLKQKQGFVTNLGAFVGRTMGKIIAREAGQIVNPISGVSQLFSEELWIDASSPPAKDEGFDALLPCPFCGGASSVDHEDLYLRRDYRAGCEICEIWTRDRGTAESAIAAWNARRSTAPVKDEGFDAAYQFGDLIKDPSKWNLDPADCHLRVPVALVSQIESELARRSTAPLDVRKAAERIALLYWPNVPFGLTREQMRDHIADELSALMEGKP